MKIGKQKITNKKKVIIAATVLVLLIASVVGVYFFLNNQQAKNNSDTTQTSKSAEQQAKDLTENHEDKQTPANTDLPPPVKTDPQTNKGAAQMVVSANVSNGTVYIRGGINNAVVSDGSCYALLTGPNGELVRKDTTLLQNPSTTDCKTIAISANELSRGGWSVKLYYSSNSMEGVSDAFPFQV